MKKFLLWSSLLWIISACASQPQATLVEPTEMQQGTLEPLPTFISTSQTDTVIDSESPTSVILKSSDINAASSLKVDEGLEISDRSDCLPKDCAFNIWNVLQQESLAPGSTSSLELSIGLRSFQTPEAAISNREKFSNIGGQPGYRMVGIPVNILPEQSLAYAHAGWFVVLITTYGNMEITVSLSYGQGGIDISESDKAAALLANLAKMQIDKIIFAKNK